MGEAYIVGRNRVSRVKWMKYSCIRHSTTTYSRVDVDPNQEEELMYTTGSASSYYTDYSFSSSEGFEGIGYDKGSISDMIGNYAVYGSQVMQFTRYERKDSGDVTMWEIYGILVADSESETTYDYEKGSTEYGLVYARKGKLPEEGERIRGYATSDYCVLKIDGTYYYYEKVIEES